MLLPIGVVNELVMGQEGLVARVAKPGTGQTSWARWIKHQKEKQADVKHGKDPWIALGVFYCQYIQPYLPSPSGSVPRCLSKPLFTSICFFDIYPIDFISPLSILPYTLNKAHLLPLLVRLAVC